MSKRGPAQHAAASIIDRLSDARPEQEHDRAASAVKTVADLRAAVRRDVEALLNARRPWRSIPDWYPLLKTSPLGFGILDFTAGAYNDPRQQEMLRAEIETVIRRFEPRLTDVKVQLVGNPSPLGASLLLRVDAMLIIDPAPEQISFDTRVNTTTADVLLQPLQGA